MASLLRPPTSRTTAVKLPGQEPARWECGDQRWSQDQDTGVFELIDFRGLGPPAKAHDPRDLATLTGAHLCLDAADREGRAVALYPGPFRFSPKTGKALGEEATHTPQVWLPPFGADTGELYKTPRGLRLTSAAISLPPSLTTDSRPTRELPLPPAGSYQFLVGNFKTDASRLLALEFAKGFVYAWLPAPRAWQELPSRGPQILGESSLSDAAWGIAVPDPVGSPLVCLPTDLGLGVVSINLVALTCEVTTVGRRCVAAPALWQGRTYVPMQREDGGVAVYAVDPARPDTIAAMPGPAVMADGIEWTLPIVDRRQIIWMSSAGQIVVKQTGAASLEVAFFPWDAGTVPRFELGSPYLSGDGHLWQQCFREDASGGRFVFVQLGRRGPEIRPTSSPRLTTGSASFTLETRLKSHPWVDPELGLDFHADEVVVPLLQSLSPPALLCARVPSTSSIDSVFASPEPWTTTFELRAERDVRFAVARVARPWTTRAFVFDGCLFLHHPDMPSILGWRMD